jgi:hypothetical protein
VYADKVVLLPFTSAKALPKPELSLAGGWARDALLASGHVLPTQAEMLSVGKAVTDGVPDTRQEYLAAGRATGAAWTVTGEVERHDVLASKLQDGTLEEGFTTYRIELEVAQVDTGRVESLAREVDPDDAVAQIKEMLTVLLRPEGVRNATLPWEGIAPKRRAKTAPPKPVEKQPEAPPRVALPRHNYAEGRPIGLGVALGGSTALLRPDAARGPSEALALGGVLAYALLDWPGVEFRGVFNAQVSGPKAFDVAVGARYALPVWPERRIFAGPELLAGTFVAQGAEKTARFLARGAAFVSYAPAESLQLEVSPELAAAVGGAGALLLGGVAARVLVRF